MLITLFNIYFSSDRKFYQSLKNLLGFYPKNISLYRLAFKHRSVVSHSKKGIQNNNERLEYLGDAVLSTVVAHYLFKMFPYKDEGFLTKMRSKLVSRFQLNRLAQKIGLDNLILSNVDNKCRNSSIQGDAFEALIGAIYLDKGYKTVSHFIINRIIKNHIDIEEIETKETDFKSKLVEWSQKEKVDIKFELIDEIGIGNDKEYVVQLLVNDEVKGEARHFSKKRAEQIVAETGCATLNILNGPSLNISLQ